MKKNILLLVSLCFCFYQNANSQYCLGDDENRVMLYAKSSKDYLLIKKQIISKDYFTISWYNTEIRARQTAYFKNRICTKFSISPDNDNSTKDIVEIIERKAIKKSETEWKEYTMGKVIKIVLNYLADVDKYIFNFTEIK